MFFAVTLGKRREAHAHDARKLISLRAVFALEFVLEFVHKGHKGVSMTNTTREGRVLWHRAVI